MTFPRRALLATAVLLLAGCAPRTPAPPAATSEATSFLGEPLHRPEIAPELRAAQEPLLAEACAAVAASPDDVEGWIWRGRRTAYLGRYREAIEVYSAAIERFPAEARLYRHRGHRYISVRDLPRAIGDLELAASLIAGSPDSVEPDGLPNARGIPTSTLHTNVHYHLGLARYLSGDFTGARRAYLAGLEASANADMRSAMSYWLVLALWRLGPAGESEARLVLATISPDWELIENEDYHALLRAFAGDGDPRELLPAARAAGGVRFATVGYGVGAWLRQRGETDEAIRIWREVVAGESWAAFGHIAAEAALAALSPRSRTLQGSRQRR